MPIPIQYVMTLIGGRMMTAISRLLKHQIPGGLLVSSKFMLFIWILEGRLAMLFVPTAIGKITQNKCIAQNVR